MEEIDDPDGVGGSANNRRWKYLIHVTKLLSEEKVELEELVNQLENPNAAGNPLDHGFLKKGKRSPRTTGNNSSRLKLTFKSSSRKCPAIVSQKITISDEDKNPIFRNPIFTCKRKKGFQNGECSTKFRRVEEPTLSETFKNRIVEIGGCLESVVFVIEKGLYVTDVSTGHGRLSVPVRQVKNKFLELDEEDELKSERGIRAALLQPCQEECEITLKYWKSNLTYVLLNGWNRVLRDNGLTEGIVIRLWSFRRNSELCFALMKILQRD